MRGLYAIIDPEQCAQDPEQLTKSVLRGGCAVLQLRDKQSRDADVVRLACSLAALCREQRVPFVLNDRFWLVREVGAQGTHLGQTDEPIENVRRELGAQIQIGVSTHNLEQAHDAVRRGADLIGFGPIFGTSSKKNPDPAVGLTLLVTAVQQINIPIVAIGGITLERAPEVALTGVPLAAAISALSNTDDPEQATRRLHAILQHAPADATRHGPRSR
jgi:thiamine-phosphate pyrophosphorylase